MSEKNVVKLQPKRPPPLTSCVFRLDPEAFAFEATLTDAEGDITLLTLVIESKSPPDFDLSRLAEAWARWREQSELVAS